jgi:UDP-N-acetylmuramyl-tripeptide synthetase
MPLELQRTLAEMKASSVDTVVLEVSSHAMDQGRIGTTLVDVAIFTNLTQDHLDYHGSMEDYFTAKQRLFTHHLKADGAAILNADDPAGRQIAYSLAAVNCAYRTVGFADSADFHVEMIDPSLGGTEIEFLDVDDQRLMLSSRLIGEFNVSNVLRAYAAARSLGLSHEHAAGAIAQFDGVPGRMQHAVGPDGSTIVIDYAHTDDALRKVLGTLRGLCRGRLIVVFGCGGDRDRSKRPLMGTAVAEFADSVFVTSDNPRTEEPQRIIDDILEGIEDSANVRVQPDRRQAITEAIAEAGEGDVVVVAGKGHEDYQEIEGVRHPFCDLEVVRELTATE